MTSLPVACIADRPAANPDAVVFACDRNYAPYAKFAATQIAVLSPARGFDICICVPEEDPALADDLADPRLRICRIATGGILAPLSLDRRRTEATYLRLAMPAAFEADYRRVLYLDSDVFVQGGDFAALLDLDLGGHAVAAVRDNIQWRTPGRRPAEFRLMGFPAARYCNCGVLLFDVAAYGGQQVLDTCLEFGRAHPGALLVNDQSLLNLVLRGDWAELSPVWNWQYTRSSALFEALEPAHVVHFIGGKKPWSHAGGALPLKFRQAYRAYFAENPADGPRVGADGLLPHRNRVYLRRMLLRHLMGAGRFADYLDRFETDLTVLL